MLNALTLTATSQDTALVDAVAFLGQFRHNPPKLVPAVLALSFASDAWQRLITTQKNKKPMYIRKHLEVCVFSYLAQELHTGDVAVYGSASYTDLRNQLLPWQECLTRLGDYCTALALPSTARAFVADLQQRLTASARHLDQQYPTSGAVVIGERGEPVLKQGPRREPPPSALQFSELVLQHTPERHLLDILHTVVRWTNCTRHFGPLSGSDAKLKDQADGENAYVRLLFTYGTHLGPSQAARHMRGAISAHSLSYLNQRHVTSAKLDAALADIVNVYDRLPLPRVWGSGTGVAADGTAYALPANNPLAEYHFRYRILSGVAYRHVADTYIATFSQFTPCGTWEAVYLIEGLLGNQSDVQPTKVYTDTQGQSTPVFALTHMLGIELLPRIRNWKDLILYKVDGAISYQHIESLFGGVIDWALIERHWQDLIQVVLSIQAGSLSSATLLRKLRYDSKRNRVYKVFQEVGRVIRTLFLLRYISDIPLREQITAETNKVESFHGFADWLNFGSDGTLSERDPEESEKLIKYVAVLANAVILHNVYDMTQAINTLRAQGQRVLRADLRHLSPYSTTQIKRFGDYLLSAASGIALDDALQWSLDEDEPGGASSA